MLRWILSKWCEWSIFSTEIDLVNILEKLHQSPELLINIANNAFNDKYLFSANHVMNSYIAALGKA